jgi:hypothetical protein
MAALTAQTVVTAGTTPSAITPAATDTIAAAFVQARGAILRIITTGTATNVTITDPGFSALGNAGTSVVIAAPATGIRMVYISPFAINPATGVVNIAASGALTGVTYELYQL